jgi:hypothetical protein
VGGLVNKESQRCLHKLDSPSSLSPCHCHAHALIQKRQSTPALCFTSLKEPTPSTATLALLQVRMHRVGRVGRSKGRVHVPTQHATLGADDSQAT